MTDREKRRILKRLRKTINQASVLLRSLGGAGHDPKNILSSKSKSKRKKFK
jgi:hypothetical protein